MAKQNNYLHLLRAFASLHWYEETIKFVFPFVAKTSELLLAAGIVISTANSLTDGAVMSHHTMVSDAWSWAQAQAIGSCLGIVFMNAFHSCSSREGSIANVAEVYAKESASLPCCAEPGEGSCTVE